MDQPGLALQRLVPLVEAALEEVYIGVEGARLRKEDRKKAVEVAALLLEIDRELARFGSRSEVLLLDAAAGKSYVGLLAARFVMEPRGLPARVITLERDPDRVRKSIEAANLLNSTITIECLQGEVQDLAIWPVQPSLVVALHACGAASDSVIENVIASRSRALLLVPCCTSNGLPVAQYASRLADEMQFPRHSAVRRRFIQACVDAERTWHLEAAGYETEVVEFVGATVTPHNLLWRARYVNEPSRVAKARMAHRLWDPRGSR